jgi:hypothetical protein
VKPQRHCEKEVAFGSRAIKLVGSYWRVPITSGTGGTIAITDSTFVNGGSLKLVTAGTFPLPGLDLAGNRSARRHDARVSQMRLLL